MESSTEEVCTENLDNKVMNAEPCMPGWFALLVNGQSRPGYHKR